MHGMCFQWRIGSGLDVIRKTLGESRAWDAHTNNMPLM